MRREEAIEALARDSDKRLQELADEAFADLLKKHERPVGLKVPALRLFGPPKIRGCWLWTVPDRTDVDAASPIVGTIIITTTPIPTSIPISAPVVPVMPVVAMVLVVAVMSVVAVMLVVAVMAAVMPVVAMVMFPALLDLDEIGCNALLQL
jgi:hypothetical protein